MTFDEIVDFGVDENFEIFVDHRGDIGSVKGRDAFEQRLRIYMTERFAPLIGEQDVEDGTIIALAEENISDAVEQFEGIDRLIAVNAEFSDETPGLLEVEVIYDVDETLTFEVEA